MLTLPVEELDGRPFAQWFLRQPVQLHGAGLRSQEERCNPAFLGALEQAAPFLAQQPVTTEVYGGDDSWGEAADPGSRWLTLLSSGHKDGVEL